MEHMYQHMPAVRFVFVPRSPSLPPSRASLSQLSGPSPPLTSSSSAWIISPRCRTVSKGSAILGLAPPPNAVRRASPASSTPSSLPSASPPLSSPPPLPFPQPPHHLAPRPQEAGEA